MGRAISRLGLAFGMERLRDVERHRPRQATVTAADPHHAHAQPSDAQPFDAKFSDAQLDLFQPQRPSHRLWGISPAYV
jgi:hypothetical protein